MSLREVGAVTGVGETQYMRGTDRTPLSFQLEAFDDVEVRSGAHGSIEVDDVQTLKTRFDPLAGDGERIGKANAFVGE